MLGLHCGFTNTLSGLQGAGDLEEEEEGGEEEHEI